MITPRQLRIREKAKQIQMMGKRERRMKYIATGQSRDNTLFMHQARKILLQVSLPGFGISLKSCYNYTESYKDKTYAAKRHHAGKGVNAKISQMASENWCFKARNQLTLDDQKCEPPAQKYGNVF